MAKRKALGRGLSALIPDSPGDQGGSRDYFVCPIEQILPGDNQPRKVFDSDRLSELAGSIKELGVLEPLIVRADGDGRYQLVAGERRWRAAQKAGLHEVPVVIRDVSDLQAIEMALVENLQREDLNPIEQAVAMSGLVEEHGYTQEQLARRLSKDRSTVANTLRLLRLPDLARQALAGGAISAGHARALLGLDTPEAMEQALAMVLERSLSVRQTETLIKRLRQPPPEPSDEQAPITPNVRDLQQRLSESLKTRVRLHATSKKRGRIEISYSSLDELDRLLEVLIK